MEIDGKRQHTVSIPAGIFVLIKAEAEARGLTVGEFNRSLLRCWLEQKPMPAREARDVEAAIAVVMTRERAATFAAEHKPDPLPEVTPPPRAQQALAAVPRAAAPTITRLPDPDFTSPDAAQKALAAIRGEDVPF